MGEQETRKGMEPPSLSGSSFLEVTVSRERWLSLVVRNTGDRVLLHFSPDPAINWLINSGKLFEHSLPDELGMRNKKDLLTLQECWADQMYLIYTVWLQQCLAWRKYCMRFSLKKSFPQQ